MGKNGIDSTKVRAMICEGMTAVQIAEEFEVSPQTVRRWARETGVTCNKEVCKSVSARAMDMTPGRAVEYLLNVLDILHGALCGDIEHEVDAWPVYLTPAERRIMIALVDANGRVLTVEQLISVMTLTGLRDEDDEGGERTLRVFVCKIRRKLPAACGAIVNVWGRGYRFERGD